MEKVPNLKIFSNRHAKRSGSLSRINNPDSYNRPTSNMQASNQSFSNYYDEALKILNSNSNINYNYQNYKTKGEGMIKNQNIKKMTINEMKNRKVIIQAPKTQINQSNPNFLESKILSPKNNHHQHLILPNQQSNHLIINNQNRQPSIKFIHPSNQNTGFSHPPNQNTGHLISHHFIPNPIPNGQTSIKIIPGQPRTSNFIQPLPRTTSSYNLNYREYPQIDHIITPVKAIQCLNSDNEQEMQLIPKTNKKTTKCKQKVDKQISKMVSSTTKTYNPFLFDATYLLDIKQSENQLPEIDIAAIAKQYSEELDKKRQLIEDLQQIKEQSITSGQNFLRQLDFLIHQFDKKPIEKIEKQQLKKSRFSLFSQNY